VPTTVSPADLVLRKCRESRDTQEIFFAQNASRIAECARAMAAAFSRGARLFALGNGGSSCDAQGAAVAFMHPVVEKRPPLPAIALAAETAFLTAVANESDYSLVFSQGLKQLARPGDIALGLSATGKSISVNWGLRTAREMQMLTVGLTGRDGGQLAALCDHAFVVPSFTLPRIREVHATLLNVLWDLVHVERGEEDVL
jgi:D-sedoheptulose 7-phosphate isomerase